MIIFIILLLSPYISSDYQFFDNFDTSYLPVHNLHIYPQNRPEANNNFQMRNRYFSPESIHYSANLNLQSPTNTRLKWVGSTNKLPSSNSALLCQSERKIGHYSYDVAQQVGSGYSSKVYKGRSTRDDSECAVKVIQLRKYSESSLRMLDNQIQILKTLDHPNIIKCYQIYKTSTHCFIITEYCSNGDLLGYLTRRGKLQEAVAVQVMHEIIEGVKYLMRKGILHRDLKPANILNNKKNWKLADFGFAIYSQGQIKTKYNVGTPLYMPLQALVKNVYSPLSDIFSVGVIFYELLTGITPWQCKNEKQLIKKMNTLPYCLGERFKIAQTTKLLLEKLCSVDPQKRLNKVQFLAINLKKEAEVLQIDEKTSSKLILQRSHSELGEELLKSNSNINIVSSKSLISEKQGDSRLQTRNNHILINQLHYCRFIYYLTRNISFLLVNSKSKNKIALILYKHLQKLIKNLADDKHNCFNLKNWDYFKQSKKYYTTLLTMKQYCSRYQKQYLNFLKKPELNVVREINKQITELSSAQSFTLSTYRCIMNVIAPLIRQANHNTTLTLNQSGESLTPQLKANIQALKSVYKYYKLVQLSAEQFQNFEAFEKKSDIKVQIDYKNSQYATFELFTQLRQQLKFI